MYSNYDYTKSFIQNYEVDDDFQLTECDWEKYFLDLFGRVRNIQLKN